jgi:Flp pilus assembly CpaF family ATPase
MSLYVFFYNKILSHSRESKRVQLFEDSADRSARVIGSHPNAEVCLESHYIPKIAALIRKGPEHWTLEVQEGRHACLINGDLISPGKVLAIQNSMVIEIFPYLLEFRLEQLEKADDHDQNLVDLLQERTTEVVRFIHRELVPEIRLELEDMKSSAELTDFLNSLEKRIEHIARQTDRLDAQLTDHLTGSCLRSELLNSLLAIDSQASENEGQDLWHSDNRWRKLASSVMTLEKELKHLRELIASDLRLDQREAIKCKEDFSRNIRKIEEGFWPTWKSYPNRLHPEFKTYLALRQLKKEIKDIVYGYGPLEDLIATPSITEIMVVNRDKIYIERDGVIENSGRRFVSDLVTESIIQRMVNNVGGHIDRSKPMADARLRDGSRINAVIAPTAVSGPALTIRKFTTQKYGIEELIRMKSISAEAAEFLKASVKDRRNIIVSGGTGSGKTTFLNILSAFIPKRERVVTVEDTAELSLKMEHVVRLESKTENVEGKGMITIRDLVKNALRMRPDRIIVGECRSGEALDMLQAMNTGHDGSMTTIHANSAEGVISRLEVLVQLASETDLPVESIHQQIVSALDIIVQLKRENNGQRHVIQISECVGIDPMTQKIRLKDIFVASPGSEMRPTGRLPSFLDALLQNGLIGLEQFLPVRETVIR